MGLGILGGGAATARWLVRRGVKLTITDKKIEKELARSIAALGDIKDRITFVLSTHREADFLENEIIVVNPDVPKNNPFLQFAKAHGKQVENELTIFYKYERPKQVIAITGTRGKTTASNWCAHLWQAHIPAAYTAGNSPQAPLLETAHKNKEAAVIETPSFLLEHFEGLAPDVALITNLYVDHLNRYQGLEDYAATKARIFLSQTPNQKLVLNFDSPWTEFFLSKKPKGQMYFFSTHTLPQRANGVYLNTAQKIIAKEKGRETLLCDAANFIKKWGAHNLENLLAALSATLAAGATKEAIIAKIETLPVITLRQERVYRDKTIEIINDSSATSPEANLAAVRRFNGNGKAIVILGGTDRELDFTSWGKEIRKSIHPAQLIFLEGSATDKMLLELEYAKNITQIYPTLRECLAHALTLARARTEPTTIVFSPGAKSFEKFKNEFDRGVQFNVLIKEYLGGRNESDQRGIREAF